MSFLGSLINSIGRLVFEAVVICLTFSYTLGVFKLQKGLKVFVDGGLSGFILQSGRLCFWVSTLPTC
jgi:hypothetical protein